MELLHHENVTRLHIAGVCRCMLVDEGGYLIFHEDMVAPPAVRSRPQIEYVHLIEKVCLVSSERHLNIQVHRQFSRCIIYMARLNLGHVS